MIDEVDKFFMRFAAFAIVANLVIGALVIGGIAIAVKWVLS